MTLAPIQGKCPVCHQDSANTSFQAGSASRDAEIAKLKEQNWELIPEKAPALVAARKERDQLRAHVNRLREALERIGRYPRVSGDELGYEGCRIVAREALATTPEQSLAEYRNKVIEDCAKRAEAYAYMSQNFNALAEELRAMKEQP